MRICWARALEVIHLQIARVGRVAREPGRQRNLNRVILPESALAHVFEPCIITDLYHELPRQHDPVNPRRLLQQVFGERLPDETIRRGRATDWIHRMARAITPMKIAVEHVHLGYEYLWWR